MVTLLNNFKNGDKKITFLIEDYLIFDDIVLAAARQAAQNCQISGDDFQP
jgi:hypothetical protein